MQIWMLQNLWFNKNDPGIFFSLLKRILASEDRYFIEYFDCNKGTDAEGNKPKTKWVSDHRGFTKNGGPYFWIHMNYACPNCVHYPHDKCCKSVPEGQFCHADSVDMADDPDVSRQLYYNV